MNRDCKIERITTKCDLFRSYMEPNALLEAALEPKLLKPTLTQNSNLFISRICLYEDLYWLECEVSWLIWTSFKVEAWKYLLLIKRTSGIIKVFDKT